MCVDTPSTERPDDYVGWKIVEWGRGSQLLEAPSGQRRRVEVFTFEAIERLHEQVDLYRVKHAELEATVDRLRAAASPVAVNQAEDAFYRAVEPGEVRT